MQGSPPPRRILNLSTRSWLLISMIAVVAVACQDSPTAPDQAKPIATDRVHPDCIEGCWGPVLDVELYSVGYQGFIRDDTVFLPDSTTTHPPFRDVAFEVGPNTADTAITVATVATVSCSNDCLQLTSVDGDGPSWPDPLSLDSEDTEEVYVYVDTVSPGSGWLSLAAGAGYEKVPVVVFHCAHRLLDGC